MRQRREWCSADLVRKDSWGRPWEDRCSRSPQGVRHAAAGAPWTFLASIEAAVPRDDYSGVARDSAKARTVASVIGCRFGTAGTRGRASLAQPCGATRKDISIRNCLRLRWTPSSALRERGNYSSLWALPGRGKTLESQPGRSRNFPASIWASKTANGGCPALILGRRARWARVQWVAHQI